MLGSGAAVRLFGLDVTRQASVPLEWIESLDALGNRCGATAAAMLRGLVAHDTSLHDPCTIAWLLAPSLFAAERCTVEVDWRPGLTEGHLAARHAGRDDPAVDLFTRVDADGLRALLRERLARLP